MENRYGVSGRIWNSLNMVPDRERVAFVRHSRIPAGHSSEGTTNLFLPCILICSVDNCFCTHNRLMGNT
jgi:hypothetical protein